MHSRPPNNFQLEDVILRTAETADHAAIRQLYHATTLGGPSRENDTGADIENLHDGYFADDGASGFWVACLREEIIGMIGVQRTGDNIAELRRLRVRQGFRGIGVGRLLVEHAIGFCRERDYLKISLDVRLEQGPAITLIEKLGFTLARKRTIGDYEVADFYLDLYTEPKT